MSNPQSQNEPSMEEILASIRRIISEEEENPPSSTPSEQAAREPKASKPADAPAPEREDDILELTEVVSEDPGVVALGKTRDEGQSAPPPARQESQAKAGLDRPQTREPAMDSKKESGTAETLLSQGAASATLASLSEVPRTAAQRKSESVAAELPNPGIVEFVRSILEPHLRAWLDENLPAITERVVREEVRRLARRAEED